jgi:hypothetical protein
MAHLTERRAFIHHLSPVRRKRWVVYSKAPFAGPEAVLAYLSHYTHRVAISNSRLIAFDMTGITFHYKDYRRNGTDRQQPGEPWRELVAAVASTNATDGMIPLTFSLVLLID